MKIPITLQEKIQRWQIKAELFLENNIQIFIKTLEGAYYSGDVIFVGESSITIYDIVKKENCRVYFLDIDKFEEYKK